MATKVSFYSVGDWHFVATVLATKISCYSVTTDVLSIQFWRLKLPFAMLATGVATVLSTGVLLLDVWRMKYLATMLATGVLSLQFWRLNFPTTVLVTGILLPACREGFCQAGVGYLYLGVNVTDRS